MVRRSVLKYCQLCVGFLPVFTAILGVLTHKDIVLWLAPFFIVIAACFLPLFRERANLWTFVFVAFLSIPLNIYILSGLQGFDIFFYTYGFMNVMSGIIYYCVLFSAEQIIFGLAAAVLRNILINIKKYEQLK